MSEGVRRILANILHSAVADVGAKIASIVFYVVMARELGDSSFGVFTFAYALATIALTLSDFGQDRILTREVSRRRERVHVYFANTLALKACVGVPVLAVATLALSGWDGERKAVVLLVGLGVLAELLMSTCFAVFQSFERLALMPVVVVTQRWLTAVVGIAALLSGAGLVAVSAIYAAGSLLGLAFAALLLFRYVVRPRLRVSVREWGPLMRAALPVGLAGIFAIVLFRVDATMLAAFEPDAVVGDYGAAYRLFEATLFLSWSVGTAVYPVFSRLTMRSRPSVGLVYQRSIKLVLALTVPFAVGAAVLAEPVIDLLYGAEFAGGAQALRLLSPAIALYPVSYVAGYLLVSQNRARVTTVVYGIVALENVLANLVLIPWLSLEGAALGTSISQLLVAVALMTAARAAVGRFDWLRALAGPVLAGSLAAAAMLLLRDSLALAVPLGALTYLATLAAFERTVFPEDALAVRSLLRRGEPQVV